MLSEFEEITQFLHGRFCCQLLLVVCSNNGVRPFQVYCFKFRHIGLRFAFLACLFQVINFDGKEQLTALVTPPAMFFHRVAPKVGAYRNNVLMERQDQQHCINIY